MFKNISDGNKTAIIVIASIIIGIVIIVMSFLAYHRGVNQDKISMMGKGATALQARIATSSNNSQLILLEALKECKK